MRIDTVGRVGPVDFGGFGGTTTNRTNTIDRKNYIHVYTRFIGAPWTARLALRARTRAIAHVRMLIYVSCLLVLLVYCVLPSSLPSPPSLVRNNPVSSSPD